MIFPPSFIPQRGVVLKSIISIFIFFLLVAIPISGGAMSLFKPLCVFSSVKGVILKNGEPVEGAEVERKYLWGDFKEKWHKEIFKTDKLGQFHFPAAYERSLLALFPHNPNVPQRITIRYQERNYEAYMRRKRNYKENSEFNGKPLELVCDLKNAPSKEGGVYGICTLK